MADFIEDSEELIKVERQHIVDSWVQRSLDRQRERTFKGTRLSESEIRRRSEHDFAESRGLALSGGGIRSAAFCIGALQALNKAHVLHRFHYLSSVSGGGYAGTALTWFYGHQDREREEDFNTGDKFPLNTAIVDQKGGTLVETLRHRASYLEPGAGLTKISILASVLRTMVISLMAYVLLLAAIFYSAGPWLIAGTWHKSWLATAFSGWPGSMGDIAAILSSWPPSGFLAVVGGVAIVLSYAFSNLAGAIGLGTFRLRHLSERLMPYLFWFALLCVGLATIKPIVMSVFDFLKANGESGGFSRSLAAIWPTIAIAGSILSAMLMRQEPTGMTRRIAATLLWVSGLALAALVASAAFSIAEFMATTVADKWWTGFWALLVVSVFAGGLANINQSGLHRFYRDRLMQAFLPDPENKSATTDMVLKSDYFELKDACPKGGTGPFHLINCHVMLTSSREAVYFSRGGDSFTLSPLYCGGDATGWKRTSTWINDSGRKADGWLSLYGFWRMRRMTLATAMAISGAAFNPRTSGGGPARSGLLSFVTTLFNLRLGYWVPNPRAEATRTFGAKLPWRALYPPNFIHPGILGGLFAAQKSETSRWIELSDGGHFDNIGIYELLRRRVKNILIVDGSTDPDLTLSSFASAYEKARNDFDVKIDILNFPANFNDMMPETARPDSPIKRQRKLAERGWAVGKITYPKTKSDDNPTVGFIFYVNTVLAERLPANLYSYHAENPAFPDEPIADQFFSEQQFEAYRELGLEITWDMMRSILLYRDLSGAIGLRAAELSWTPDLPVSETEIESSDLKEDFAGNFPSRSVMSIPEYLADPDRLDWPPPPLLPAGGPRKIKSRKLARRLRRKLHTA